MTSVVFQAYVSTMSVSSSLSSASADQARHQDALREQLPDPRHDCVLLLRGRRRREAVEGGVAGVRERAFFFLEQLLQSLGASTFGARGGGPQLGVVSLLVGGRVRVDVVHRGGSREGVFLGEEEAALPGAVRGSHVLIGLRVGAARVGALSAAVARRGRRSSAGGTLPFARTSRGSFAGASFGESAACANDHSPGCVRGVCDPRMRLRSSRPMAGGPREVAGNEEEFRCD